MSEQTPRKCGNAVYLGFLDGHDLIVCLRKDRPIRNDETFLGLCWYDDSDGRYEVECRFGVIHYDFDSTCDMCCKCDGFAPVTDSEEISKRGKWGKK